jgi:hypothetical protein
MTNHFYSSGRSQPNEQLTILFAPLDHANTSLAFHFIDHQFTASVRLAEARHLYRKLSASRFWLQTDDQRKLIAVNIETASQCPRCCGSGDLPQFRHVQGGICFLCWGSGGRWGTERSEGAVYDFAKACQTEELGNLYDRLKQYMEGAFKEASMNARQEQKKIEMEKIRERRRKKHSKNRLSTISVQPL